MSDYQIHKAAAIILKDKKHLLERSKGKEIFVEPGGKLKEGETAQQALIRELNEELNITVKEEDLEFFGTFYAPAAGQENLQLRMDVFTVKAWQGEIEPGMEVEELAWVGPIIPAGMKVGSIFEHDILPRLIKEGLID